MSSTKLFACPLLLAVVTMTTMLMAASDMFVDAFIVMPTPSGSSHSARRLATSPSSSIRTVTSPLFSSTWGMDQDPLQREQRQLRQMGGSPPNIDTSPGGALAAPVTSDDIWQTLQPIKVQGGSLRTWSFATPLIDSVQVHLRTEGRPLNANVELWQGPDNTPQKIAVYLEDGSIRPFRCTILTPQAQNAIAVRNTAQMEYPLMAGVEADLATTLPGEGTMQDRLAAIPCRRTIQGGAVFTMPFNPSVASVQILLKTDGRPLNCRIELLQGPNNVKQVMEVYTEAGDVRPFFTILDTPGTGNVVRIVNTSTIEFPISANVEPFLVEEAYDDYFMVSDEQGANGRNSFFMDSGR